MINPLIQSEACHLPADARSLMQSPPVLRGQVHEASAQNFAHFCQSQDPLSSHITSAFPAITAKQQQKHNLPTSAQCSFSFPEGEKLVRSLQGYCFAQSSQRADSKYRSAAYTFPGLKPPAASGSRTLSHSFMRSRNHAGCSNPLLNYTGDSASLSLSCERMNQMIPLLVSHQLFSFWFSMYQPICF